MNWTTLLIIYSALLPLIIILVWMIIKNYNKIRNSNRIEKFKKISLPNSKNFQVVSSQPNIKMDWNLPRGEDNKPYYQLNASNLYKAEKNRQIKSTSITSGLFGLSGNKGIRKIQYKVDWMEMGMVDILFTNKDIWFRGELVNYRYKISEVEEAKISSYGDLLVKFKTKSWPIRLDLGRGDIVTFCNLVHTKRK